MSNHAKNKTKSRASKILRRILYAFCALVICCAALLLALPALFSSSLIRGQVLETLATATGKPVRLETLSFSWGDGLRLKALCIGQGALTDPEFLASVDTLHADIDLLAALKGDVRLALDLRGLRLRVPPKDQNLPEAPAKPLPDALREMFASLRTALKPLPLLQNAKVQVNLSDSAVLLAGAPGAQNLELRGLGVQIKAPDLRLQPVSVKASLELLAGMGRPAPVRFDATIDRLTDSTGRFAPAQAQLKARLEAPGLDVTASGSLNQVLTLSLRAKLKEALAPALALAQNALPELDGALALNLSLQQSDPSHLNVGLVLFADALRAARGPLGDKHLGPLSFNLLQELQLDLQAETLRAPGSLDIKPSGNARWLGGLAGLPQGDPRATLALDRLHLALGELIPALRAYLPPGFGVGSGTLDLASLELTANLPGPKQGTTFEARLKGLDFSAQNISRKEPSGGLHVKSARVHVESASASLPAAGPGQAETQLNAALEGISLAPAANAAKKPLTLALLALLGCSLQAEGLRQDSAALFGISGTAVLEQQLQAKAISAPGKLEVPDLSQRARLRIELPSANAAMVRLETLELDAPLLRTLQPGKKPLETPLSLRASAPEIRLTGPAPLTPSLRELKLTLNIGEALGSVCTLSLTGNTGRDLSSEGQLTVDARKLMALAAPFAPAKAKASGTLAAAWKLSASLPAPKPEQSVSKPAAPMTLSRSLKQLDFIHEARASLTLGDLDLDWPLAAASGAPAETLRLRGARTASPLLVTMKNGMREMSLTGSLGFGPMSDLPGLGHLAQPLSGLLTLSAGMQNARSLQLAEALHLDGLQLDQTFSVNLDKLDTMLDREDRLTALLELVDGSMDFKLKASLSPAQAEKALEKGIVGIGKLLKTKTKTAQGHAFGTGQVEAAAEARLAGGRSLALSARLLSPGLELRLGPDLVISGLSSNLSFQRRFTLSPGLRCPGSDAFAAAPLSEQVIGLEATALSTGYAGAGTLAAQTRTGFGGTGVGGTGGGSFSLARLKLKAGGLPLDIHDLELQLDTSGPIPGLRSFRAGLLGGDIKGNAMLSPKAGRYQLSANLDFTGIDPSRLLPAKASKDMGSQAETSGRIRIVSVPLTPDPELLLQGIELYADITKIGPRTLERLLYALDPEEQNETIVQQRRLMDIGYPRLIRTGVAFGNLTLSGVVEVKGFQLDLPPLDRLRIANLPIRRQLAKPLASVPALIKALDAASGSQICRNPADAPGVLRFVQP